MPSINNLRKLISILAILAMMLLNLQPLPAKAQNEDGLRRQFNTESHKVSFIGPASGRVLPAAKALGTSVHPQDPAMALAKRFAPEFGLKNPERDLAVMKNHRNADGRLMVRYQQKYQGIPVIGGELIVNTNDNGDMYSMSGEVSPDLSIATQPTIAPEQARQTALKSIAKWYRKNPEDFSTSPAELWIYDESLLRPSTRPVELAWRMEVTSKDMVIPVSEFVLINAQHGSMSLHFNQVDTAWGAMGKDKNTNVSTGNTPIASSDVTTLSAQVSTYTANNTSTLPGSFLCNQTDPNCAAGDSHAKAAHKYAIGTDDFYFTHFSRNSIDNNGMVITSTVHYCSSDPFLGCPYPNAFWSGEQMVYGDAYGFALADDVVAHELTHGVTQNESNLFYLYQSGAINESFSDVFGEYYDQTNGLGSDGVKWLIGEDVTDLGAIRSMSNPPDYENPDKMSSSFYSTDGSDNGGVHSNSGINNKAVYLMVEGGTFNGKTITGLGWDKVGAIYYEVNTNLLTSGADYSDLYYALQQACTNLIGQHSITSGDCTQVKNALDAVEMHDQPAPNFNTDAPFCDGNGVPITYLADDLENGTSNWTFNNGANTRWQIDSTLYGPNAQSGLHSLFGAPYPAAVIDVNARFASFVVPANSYLWFAQTYEYEAFFGEFFDGGILEYSNNGGSTWQDAEPLIDTNGYNGVIASDYGNPLGGRSGFVGSSHGYISTRLNLSSLAGQNVTFRWRFGLDGYGSYGEEEIGGWWVDNIQVYTCASNAAVNVEIGGSLRGNYAIPFRDEVRANYANLDSGPVKVISTNNVPIVAALRDLWWNGLAYTSSIQLMGLPQNLLSDTYVFPSYNNVNLNDQLRFGNVGNANTVVTVTIGGVVMGNYPLQPNERGKVNYSGLDSGPVIVHSSNGVPIIASIRDAWIVNGTTTSFSQLMGLPQSQLSDTYIFPSYNNVSLSDQLRFGNVGNAPTTVTVTIGGVVRGTYPLQPNQRDKASYAGLDSGPVIVKSSNGVPIIASLREAWINNGVTTSYFQMMGLPQSQLSDKYVYPSYDNVSLSGQLRFGNVGNTNTTVTVTIGGVVKGNYPLAPNQREKVSYAGVNSGPVVVQSSNGVEIIASLRDAWLVNGVTTSFSQLMGLPGGQLSTIYVFPSYNNATYDNQLRIGVP